MRFVNLSNQALSYELGIKRRVNLGAYNLGREIDT